MKRKIPIYNVVIVVILSLIIIIGSMVVFLNPERKSHKKPVSNSIESPATPVKPVFRKDGELRFLEGKTFSPITTIDVEVADTDPEKEQGLMYRDTMAENRGMLFLMGTEDTQSFWMKNTIISLDILYVNSERRIVSIHKNTKPYSLEQIISAKPAMYVVEVNAGYTDKYGIKVNDLISF